MDGCQLLSIAKTSNRWPFLYISIHHHPSEYLSDTPPPSPTQCVPQKAFSDNYFFHCGCKYLENNLFSYNARWYAWFNRGLYILYSYIYSHIEIPAHNDFDSEHYYEGLVGVDIACLFFWCQTTVSVGANGQVLKMIQNNYDYHEMINLIIMRW